MSYFVFNNENSRNFGILEHCPLPEKSQREYAVQEVPGATEKIMTVSTAYNDIVIPCVLGLKDREKLRQAYQWLDGTGTLAFSQRPDEFYTVKDVKIGSEYLSVRFCKLNIEFTCSPFAYLLPQTSVDLSAAKDSFVEVPNAGTVFSAPEIRFTPAAAGDAVLNVNGAEFIIRIPESLKNKEIIVDSEANAAYYEENGLKYPVTEYTFNAFPLLHTGTNYAKYSGELSAVVINVRERCL